MNPLEAGLRRAAQDLDTLGVGWALIGGFAISARTEPRFTRDVDIAVAVDDDATAEHLIRSFLAVGYHPLATVEHEASGRLATIRLASPAAPEDHVVIDLLFSSSGIEPEIAEASERIELIPGLTLPVASTGHLIALKLLSRNDVSRPQDAADLQQLAHVATPADRLIAQRAVTLITQRGFHRDRDLSRALHDLVARR